MITDVIPQITASGQSPDPWTGAQLVSHRRGNRQIISCSIMEERSQVALLDSVGRVLKKDFHDIPDAVAYARNQITAKNTRHPR